MKMLALVNQVQHREEEDPDHVHHVPVKADQIYGREVIGAEFSFVWIGGVDSQPRQEPDGADNCKGPPACLSKPAPERPADVKSCDYENRPGQNLGTWNEPVHRLRNS